MKLLISNLNISYQEHTVIKDFNETINPGEKIALTGTSGIGKTSIINAIMGLIPFEGNINFGKTPQFSTIFQEDRLLPDHSVFGNIKITSLKLNNSVINECIEYFKLNPKDYVSTLSGGMQRKVAILRALLAPSNIIIMDEPFKGLDDETKELVMSFTKKKASDKTMILITHDLSEAKFFDCRIINVDAFSVQQL